MRSFNSKILWLIVGVLSGNENDLKDPNSTKHPRTPSSMAFPTKTPQSPHQLKSTLFRLDAYFQNPCLLSPRGRTSRPENWLGTFTCGNPCHPQPTTLSSADLYALKFAFLTLTGSKEARLHADFPSLFMSCRCCFNLITFVYLSLTFSGLGPRDNFPQIIIFNKRIG